MMEVARSTGFHLALFVDLRKVFVK